MAETYFEYTGDGSRTVYPVVFTLGYLDQSHIKVYTGTDPDVELAYTWPNTTSIELGAAVANGTLLTVRRVVPTNVLTNDYSQGAVLNDAQLDDSFRQALMVAEQTLDVTEDTQAAAASAATATTQAGLATTARTGAETAETNAETAQTNSETAQTAAETAQTASEEARDVAVAINLNGAGSIITLNQGTADGEVQTNAQNGQVVLQQFNQGDFATAAILRVARSGKICALSLSGGHTTGTTATSGVGEVPAWARPVVNVNTVYGYEPPFGGAEGFFTSALLTTVGTLSIAHWDAVTGQPRSGVSTHGTVTLSYQVA